LISLYVAAVEVQRELLKSRSGQFETGNSEWLWDAIGAKTVATGEETCSLVVVLVMDQASQLMNRVVRDDGRSLFRVLRTANRQASLMGYNLVLVYVDTQLQLNNQVPSLELTSSHRMLLTDTENGKNLVSRQCGKNCCCIGSSCDPSIHRKPIGN
jgi:hypothetical protein